MDWRKIAGILLRCIFECRNRPVEIDAKKFQLRRVEIGAHGLGSGNRHFIPARRIARRAALLWRAVAMVGLLMAIAWPASLAWQRHLLENAAQTLAATNAQLLKTTFPAITRVVNARVQADQALTKLRAGADNSVSFLLLLAKLDAVQRSSFPPAARIARLHYADSVLELSIETGDMNDIEAIRGVLGQQGLKAEMLAAESAADKVTARVRVREAQ